MHQDVVNDHNVSSSSSSSSTTPQTNEQPSSTQKEIITMVHLLEEMNIVLVGDEGVGKTTCLITYSELMNKVSGHATEDYYHDMMSMTTKTSILTGTGGTHNSRGCDYIPSVVETLKKQVTIKKTLLGHCKFVNNSTNSIGSSSGNTDSALDQSSLPFDNTCETFTMNVNFIDTPGQEDQSLDRIKHYYPNATVFVLMFSVDDIASFQNLSDYWLKEIKSISHHPCIMIVGNKSDVGVEERHVTRLDGLGMQNKIGAKMYMEISSTTGINVVNMFDACVRLGTKELDTRCAHLLYNKQQQQVLVQDQKSMIHLDHHLIQNPHQLVVGKNLSLSIPLKGGGESLTATSTATTSTSRETPTLPITILSQSNTSSNVTSTESSAHTSPNITQKYTSLSKIIKQMSFGTPLVVEKEFRFGVELLPKLYLENDPESEVLKKLNFKIKKIVKVKIDVNMNPLCQLKRQIISSFGKENQKIWSRKTEEQWLKSLKVQILDNIFQDYYDLDDWEQVVSQKEDNIKLLVFY